MSLEERWRLRRRHGPFSHSIQVAAPFISPWPEARPARKIRKISCCVVCRSRCRPKGGRCHRAPPWRWLIKNVTHGRSQWLRGRCFRALKSASIPSYYEPRQGDALMGEVAENDLMNGWAAMVSSEGARVIAIHSGEEAVSLIRSPAGGDSVAGCLTPADFEPAVIQVDIALNGILQSAERAAMWLPE